MKNNTMKVLSILVLAVLITSCNAPKAVYDYDQKTDFTSVHSFKMYPDLVTKMNQLDEQRMLSIISEEMTAKGFTQEENAGMYVNFYATQYETQSNNNLGIGVGGGGGNVGVGVSGGIPIGGPQFVLKITFDFIDVKSDSLIWEAIVTSKVNKNVSPQKRTAQLRALFKKALEGYPPKK